MFSRYVNSRQARNRRRRSDRLQIRDYGHLNELVDRSERGDQDQNSKGKEILLTIRKAQTEQSRFAPPAEALFFESTFF